MPQRAPLSIRRERSHHANPSPPPRPHDYQHTPGSGLAQFRMPFLTTPLLGFKRQRSAGKHLFGLVRPDAVSGDVSRVGSVPVESRILCAGHLSVVYTHSPYKAMIVRQQPIRPSYAIDLRLRKRCAVEGMMSVPSEPTSPGRATNPGLCRLRNKPRSAAQQPPQGPHRDRTGLQRPLVEFREPERRPLGFLVLLPQPDPFAPAGVIRR